MGRGNFKGGNVFAQNIQAGSVDITTDGSGDGSATVTFPKAMKNVPMVIATIAEADITGNITTATRKNASVSIVVDGSAVTSGTLTVCWMAFDDNYN